MIKIVFALLCISTTIPITYIHAAASECQNIENMTAQEVLELCKPDTGPSGNVDTVEAIKERIKVALIALISIGSLASIAMIVYAGFQYVTVFEDDGKAKKAKSTAIAAVV